MKLLSKKQERCRKR